MKMNGSGDGRITIRKPMKRRLQNVKPKLMHGRKKKGALPDGIERKPAEG